jgi:hypothetical protein
MKLSRMLSTASKLETLINDYLPQLKNISEDKLSYKPLPAKWSKKEIVGHLIDSAQNNIRRFIVAQYEDNPMIRYDQDKWVAITNYQHMDPSLIIELWYLLNKQISSILQNTTKEAAQRTSKTEDIHTIEWLAEDYIRHLKHHMHQVLELEPFVY